MELEKSRDLDEAEGQFFTCKEVLIAVAAYVNWKHLSRRSSECIAM
jgi:hypothetical protein